MTHMKKLLLPAAALLMLSGCNRNNIQQQQQKIDSLQQVIQIFKASQDSLQQAMTGGSTAHNTAESWSYSRFEQYGIPDPEAFIDSTLRSRPQLIPVKGVLGGTMQFYKIQLINDIWVYAEYEDGHISGSTIFQYTFNTDGSLQFKPVLQYAPYK